MDRRQIQCALGDLSSVILPILINSNTQQLKVLELKVLEIIKETCNSNTQQLKVLEIIAETYFASNRSMATIGVCKQLLPTLCGIPAGFTPSKVEGRL